MTKSRISDFQHPEYPPQGLPIITEILYGINSYNPPIQRLTGITKITMYKESLEIRIRTDRPIPVQATSPVLFIGEYVLDDYRLTEHLSYTFYMFDHHLLPETSAIYWGWNDDPERKERTRFNFSRVNLKRF